MMEDHKGKYNTFDSGNRKGFRETAEFEPSLEIKIAHYPAWTRLETSQAVCSA